MTAPLLTMPTSANIAEVVFKIKDVVARTFSPYTLQDQAFRWPGEQWMVDFTLPPIGDVDVANEWKAFGVRLEGSYGRFYMGDPSSPTPRGAATGTPLIKGAGQLGNSIVTDGWAAGVTNILKAGDYVQIGTRLHMQMVNVNSNGSGEATLTLRPAVISAPADNSAVVVNSPKGIFKMTSNTFEWRVSPGPIYYISFQAEEVVGA